MAANGRSRAKQVVYLWGAGATQAEAHRLGAPISLLMGDTKQFGEGITTRILRRIDAPVAAAFGNGQGIDIEKLISLLDGSGVRQHTGWANKMRSNYFAEIADSLATANVRNNPQLAIRLLELHKDAKFKNEVETLTGIITTNHDGLLQVASQRVFDGVNIGFPFVSTDFKEASSRSVPPIFQVHGSFTWQFGIPIEISKLRKKSKYTDAVWIPPTILKESKNYPFNKLTGLAYELLAKQCDVLRIVGASLTQNDWNILSLIFNAQRHREAAKGTAFLIELILPHDHGEKLKDECAYLKHITPIGYLTDGNFSDYKDTRIPPDSDMANPFAYWLNEKCTYHQSRNELSPHGTADSTV